MTIDNSWVCTDPEKFPKEWKEMYEKEMSEREKRKNIICEHINKSNDPRLIEYWEHIMLIAAENKKDDGYCLIEFNNAIETQIFTALCTNKGIKQLELTDGTKIRASDLEIRVHVSEVFLDSELIPEFKKLRNKFRYVFYEELLNQNKSAVKIVEDFIELIYAGDTEKIYSLYSLQEQLSRKIIGGRHHQ